ncbi:hypothetical protein [Dolichospermum compactum]|uniref:Uncharacterized protein n=1 Tax=Dolichospermum compactum NIES-806 TaxID=1973481 RepID=A0A1Z4V7W9_9CYAN|nr:hypothetical protein [Dolichospermum compactum]BAZ87627.1 hypothetical protein NIES806_38570 [Dolichospermum compactum NIES-806]
MTYRDPEIEIELLRLKSELNISGKNNSQRNSQSQCLDDVITEKF